jgi:hypothetical protein
MQASLAFTALLMGLAGGPHCVAMCGAACAGIGQAAGPRRGRALLGFQAGRLVGYSALGGVAAASMQALGWLGTQSAALRPAWTLLHVAAMLLGVLLLVRARQPLWLEAGARGAWQHVRRLTASHAGGAPLVVGAAWALLPCGLLYSALMVAALGGSVVQGMGVMALFAVGSGVSLLAGPWLWLRWSGRGGVAPAGGLRGQWGVRLAGAALAGMSAWALYQGLVHDMAPWCVTPAGAL